MTLNRRSLLVAGPASLVLVGVPASPAGAAEAAMGPFADFRSPENDPEFGHPGQVSTGTAPPFQAEIEIAARLMVGAPHAPNPKGGKGIDHMEVAKYFLAIETKNGDREQFNREWLVKHGGVARANPLITGFFSMTHTAPSLVKESGDQLAWCAAFANTVLALSGRSGTWSALSGSFRKGPFEATKSPKYGDLVVFRDRGEGGDNGHGHVTFYVGPGSKDGVIEVLGGNQRIAGDPTTGAVCQVEMALETKSHYLHSFRRVA